MSWSSVWAAPASADPIVKIDQRAHEQPPDAPQVGQPAGHRHGQDVDQQVAVDDPAGLAQLDPGGAAVRIRQVGQDRRQGDRGDHELEAGQEDADPDDGEEHVRRAAVHAGECSLAGVEPACAVSLARRRQAVPSRTSPLEPAIDRRPAVAADEVSVGSSDGARHDDGHAVAPVLCAPVLPASKRRRPDVSVVRRPAVADDRGAELDRAPERGRTVQIDSRDAGRADGPDHDRFGRVVAEGQGLSPVVSLGDGRIEPDRILGEIPAVAGAGRDLQAGTGRCVEQRGRDGADPAGERAVRIDMVTDDDRAESVAGPSRHLADRGPEVERCAGLDDEPVKASERDDDVRSLAVGRPHDVRDRPTAQQDEVRLERHDGAGADGGHRAPTRPTPRRPCRPADRGRRDGRRRGDDQRGGRGSGRGDPNRRGRRNVLRGPAHRDLDGRGTQEGDDNGRQDRRHAAS